MGLFDYVHVDRPGFDPSEAFQTKDFDAPYMDRYDIAKDGRLIFTEWPKGGNAPPPKDMEFHGMLYFYTLRSNDDWVTCEAKFTDGNLVEIKQEIHPPGSPGRG